MNGAPRGAQTGRYVTIGLTVVLLGLGAWRLTSDALRRPVVGYGDNYDMLRLMDLYGIWPAEGVRGTNHPQAPWRRYVFRPPPFFVPRVMRVWVR
jgi:hypothetical protein